MVEGDWETVKVPPRPFPAAEAVKEAADLLLGADRPCLYVGGGAIGAEVSITAIAERLDASVITSNAGKGIVPESHSLSVGGSIWRRRLKTTLPRPMLSSPWARKSEKPTALLNGFP